MANFAQIHGQPSSSFLHSTRRKRLEDIVRQRCQSKYPLGINEALDLFHQMLHEMPKPQISSFNLLLTSISRMKDTHHHHHLPTVISLYGKMNWVGGISSNVITFGIFINCFSRMNRVDLGFAVFGTMLKRGWSGNTIIFNSFINGLCQQNKVGEAQLLDRMPRMGFTPNVFSYNTLIKEFCNTGNASSAIELLQKMSEDGVGCKPDVVTYNTVIDALSKGGTLDITFKLFEKMVDAGIAPNVINGNTLIDAFCKEGAMDRASMLFNEMTALRIAPDVVTYTSIINGHSISGLWKEAIKVFREMVDRGLSPDVVVRRRVGKTHLHYRHAEAKTNFFCETRLKKDHPIKIMTTKVSLRF